MFKLTAIVCFLSMGSMTFRFMYEGRITVNF
jgi:hypothetical protein